MPIQGEWGQMEALWSRDSQNFSLTGNLNGYTNSTEIFRIKNGALETVSITPLYKDMAHAYPPCRAWKQVLGDCRQYDGKDFNYATVAWAGPATAVVMAEVPCDSLWGGIMCQVKAYELDITTQRIVARMSAREFRDKWQPYLYWKFHMPSPPKWAAPAESSK